MQKIHVVKFALAWGISFGLYLMVLGWFASFGWGTKIVDVVSSLYIGYAPTFLGGIIGGIYAFADWFIGILIVGWIYNRLIADKSSENKQM